MPKEIKVDKEPLEDVEKLEILPSLIKAYIINMGKTLLLVAALAGAVYLVQYIVGTNPFEEMFSALGIPMVWVMRSIMAIIAILLILTFFSTLSLTSYSLLFEAGSLKYSYGSFFKVTRSTPISNVIRVNFKEYFPFRIGDIVLELSGTEDRTLRIRYVSDVRHKAELINRLISLRNGVQ